MGVLILIFLSIGVLGTLKGFGMLNDPDFWYRPWYEQKELNRKRIIKKNKTKN